MIDTLDKTQIAARFRALQDDICRQLEAADGSGRFREDAWERPGGGGGRARVIEGAHIEKGGVNFSAVHGAMPEKISMALQLDQADFFATGVSIVLHPKSPMVPIIHMNVRYFEMSNGTWWFGGGIDLTPHYVVPGDAAYFHGQLKQVCDAHHADFYPEFKKWADDYFYLRHRSETRGIGGIFFDRLNEQSRGLTKAELFDYVLAVGNIFAPTYTELLKCHKAEPYGERELQWQGVRRGRYVEFNLVWDKGTKFGLDTDGRTESILMSMPPIARWIYDHQVEEGSAEAETLAYLKKGIDWV
ncbi:oxygen-dependent coproporphyrinogen oxidase [Flavilitoribacter nigricans]|uniref:coproporphyrinogen oxidase n=1 Tax=Flavilitoribacter nigricans (strain ATCC 23147 / DSM 23189 / NBRC 102662 / NCIMB 1420 / SS-2) TaxID=1122177 RepID=A0A2D0NBH7_FLAN2|nr:oxygen-dependent coproporphyrinogen oxidase [Flavilitoribacter nigricans]PHN05847.1 oxygen-dependent coproporphyrinogen oxidase [Flavilitoribacter nigricans DSM 23189 = NBRC 102662]